MTKVAADAFDLYVRLGPTRSYEAVAQHYQVTKGAITKRATREHWQDRLAQVEAAARSRSDAKLVDTIEEMNARHLKIVQAVLSKALSALQAMSIDSGMDAVRAVDLCIKQERLIRGEPGDRSAVSVEELVRSEYQRWMKPVPDESNHDTSRAPK